MFESKFLLLHKNLNFPVMPLVVILCHCFKVDIFHFFLFFHTPLTFSFFLYTHSFFFNTHTFFYTAQNTSERGSENFFHMHFKASERSKQGARAQHRSAEKSAGFSLVHFFVERIYKKKAK